MAATITKNIEFKILFYSSKVFDSGFNYLLSYINYILIYVALFSKTISVHFLSQIGHVSLKSAYYTYINNEAKVNLCNRSVLP